MIREPSMTIVATADEKTSRGERRRYIFDNYVRVRVLSVYCTHPPNDVHHHVLVSVANTDEISTSSLAVVTCRCPRPVGSVFELPRLVAAGLDVGPVVRTYCGTNDVICMNH